VGEWGGSFVGIARDKLGMLVRKQGKAVMEEKMCAYGEGTPECGMQLGEGTVALVGMHYGSLREDRIRETEYTDM
jgi:hypothetical protein